MGWFSRSATSSPVEAPQQQDTRPSLAKDGSALGSGSGLGSPAASLNSSSVLEVPVGTPVTVAAAHAVTAITSTEAHLHVPGGRFPAEALEFDEYKAPDDIYARFKVGDAMNELAACSSLGANIRNYYRYGKYKDCADRYDHLKFCMSLKTKSSQVAQVMIQKRDADVRAKKKSLPNSEDVWIARTHPPEELVQLAREA